VTDIEFELIHIGDQVEKQQYWNAIAACVRLLRILLVKFDEILEQKGD